ncbi:MAG: polysaccharide pyruvyl transferase family protein [Bacteroidales bacterium]|nr:polysaccharide pyruvyl transferase family protein [Bacteroidales bacterium]
MKKSIVACLVAMAIIFIGTLTGCKKHTPVILLRSGWQVENIGDISHTPGFLAIAEKYYPEAEVIYWPFYGLLPEEEVTMLKNRFPRLTIVQGTVNDNGTCSNKALTDAFTRADILIHNSGPSMLSWREALAFKAQTGKPYGVYGVTYGLYGTPEREALNQAAFVYFRDTVSLNNAIAAGIHCPKMEWTPDAAFGTDVEDSAKAIATLKEMGLEEGKYICFNPNQRRTPFWEHAYKQRAFDPAVQHLNDSLRDHDHNPMLEAITQVVRTTDLKVFIVHEDQTEFQIGKDWIYDKLPADVQKRCVWLNHYWTLDEAIGVFKRSVGLVSHEMHCPIMCIANDIPAIVVRWKEQSTKGYMWQTIGLGEWLIDFDKEEEVAKYVPTVVEFATHPEESKAKAVEANKLVNARMAETMAVIKATIEQK